MIDLSRMNGVRVDPEARRAYVGGGSSWAALDAATAPHGLAVSVGRSATPGSPGSPSAAAWAGSSRSRDSAATTWWRPRWSPRTAGSSPPPRTPSPTCSGRCAGPGPTSAWSTELVFALHEVDPMAHLGFFCWAPEDAAEPFAFAREHLFALPDSIGALVVGLSAPRPRSCRRAPGQAGFAVLVGGLGRSGRACRGHRTASWPRRRCSSWSRRSRTSALQQLIDATEPWGIRAYDKGINLDDLSDEAIAVFLDWVSASRGRCRSRRSSRCAASPEGTPTRPPRSAAPAARAGP